MTRPLRRRKCSPSSCGFIVATNSRSNESPDSFGFNVRRWRRKPSTISISSGPIAVVNGSGRRRREARKLYCLPAKATPAKPSITLRLGCQPSPMSKMKSPPGYGMAGVPEPLHPGRIGAHDVVERGRQLVADEVVLFGQHDGRPCQALFSAPLEISTNIGLALVESSHFNCRRDSDRSTRRRAPPRRAHVSRDASRASRSTRIGARRRASRIASSSAALGSPAGARTVRQRRARQVRRRAASSSRLASSSARNCSSRKCVGPGGAQLHAVQHVDHAERLAAREIALDVRNDLLAQGRDHAVDQPGQRIVHGARSRILAICRKTGAIWVAIAGMRISLNRPSSKQRAAAICVSASFSSEKTM